MIKVQFSALIALSFIGCAHTAVTQPSAPQLPAADICLAAELFYENAKLDTDVYHVDGWDGDVSAVASQVAKGWHARGVSTDFQQESRSGTRVSFSAHKPGSKNRYKVIVQEVSREAGIVMVVYAAWPEDLDSAFSKQFEIEVDKIIRRMVIEEVPARKGPAGISI